MIGFLAVWLSEDRLPEGHICFLIDEIVDELESSSATRSNTVLEAPSYDPRMMVKVLFYGYVRGIRSSRPVRNICFFYFEGLCSIGWP